jgi:hypothetical protein
MLPGIDRKISDDIHEGDSGSDLGPIDQDVHRRSVG